MRRASRGGSPRPARRGRRPARHGRRAARRRRGAGPADRSPARETGARRTGSAPTRAGWGADAVAVAGTVPAPAPRRAGRAPGTGRSRRTPRTAATSRRAGCGRGAELPGRSTACVRYGRYGWAGWVGGGRPGGAAADPWRG
ncbi:hypothetical protein CP974_29160 [Streptomyces fradiae ATCC 10745 = DSM 40063]|nr:hypothetical protein CP974_29160 [Streptomyces fradiae ATCC 10745 = DSM 40063]